MYITIIPFCYLLVTLRAQDKEAINQLKVKERRVHYHSHGRKRQGFIKILAEWVEHDKD
jgi:hypothetical protein